MFLCKSKELRKNSIDSATLQLLWRNVGEICTEHIESQGTFGMKNSLNINEVNCQLCSQLIHRWVLSSIADLRTGHRVITNGFCCLGKQCHWKTLALLIFCNTTSVCLVTFFLELIPVMSYFNSA
eukprot:TRINITY_DN14055_c0_g1_i1.p1 TRINITY_DN14055_c0_g1~~TRINITY_DN14055_c0_g1_i1.p1  ORF type:complete len:125 (+),score=19.41 TRINITY_DN14055_c0_g1_i1:417-791(+)